MRVVENFGIEHVHERRRQTTLRHVARGRHHHIAERQLGHKFEVRHQRGVGRGGHLVCLRHETRHIYLHLQRTEGEIFEHEVPRHVGRHGNTVTFHRHQDMGQELARGGVAHVPHDVRRPIVGCGRGG